MSDRHFNAYVKELESFKYQALEDVAKKSIQQGANGSLLVSYGPSLKCLEALVPSLHLLAQYLAECAEPAPVK